MMRRMAVVTSLLMFGGCVDFDGALAEYCRHNPGLGLPQCDAGVMSPDAGTDAGVDAGSADAGTDAGSGAGTDAGTDAGLVDAGPDAGVVDGGPDAGNTASPTVLIGPRAVPCPVDNGVVSAVYVLASGGTDTPGAGARGSPFKTIGYALAHANGVAEVRVCSGVYTERVVISNPVALKGGYDCTTGSRPALCFDPDAGPTYFAPGAPASTTLIVDPSTPAAGMHTVQVTATGSVVIDGFTVMGPDAGSSQANAMFIAGGQTIISNNRILGGKANTADWFATSGIHFETSAWDTSEVRNNVVNGGSGSATTGLGGPYAGSLGIFLTGGVHAANIHDNVIEGGSGACAGGCYSSSSGIFVDHPQSAASIEWNQISGGTGTTTSSNRVLKNSPWTIDEAPAA